MHGCLAEMGPSWGCPWCYKHPPASLKHEGLTSKHWPVLVERGGEGFVSQHAEVAHVLIRGLTKRTEPAGSIEPVQSCVTWRSKSLSRSNSVSSCGKRTTCSATSLRALEKHSAVCDRKLVLIQCYKCRSRWFLLHVYLEIPAAIWHGLCCETTSIMRASNTALNVARKKVAGHVLASVAGPHRTA